MTDTPKQLNLLDELVRTAKKSGADAADAILLDGTSISSEIRLGKPELVERSEGGDLGLRVFVGRKQAVVSSSDRSPAALKELVERAVAMAHHVPEDAFCGLAEPDMLATDIPELDLVDSIVPDAGFAMDQALAAEQAAMDIEGVTNSGGAGFSHSLVKVSIAGTNGLARSYARSGASLSVSVLAGKDGQTRERDYAFSSAVYTNDLKKPLDIGREAGQRAVARLNSQKIKSAQMPVVFEPRTAKSILSHFLSAINGRAITRKTSFLQNEMGQAVFADGITIIDNPLRLRGLKSRPIDGEGLQTQARTLVEKGMLQSWVLDLWTARKLGLQSTACASRSVSSAPSPSSSNVHIEPGKLTPGELIGGIKHGLYITELSGQGVNGITGDYSRGACGFLIENGKKTIPVSEVTIAGNLKDMFAKTVAANDLQFVYGINSPTLCIENMTVAGQ